MDADAVTSPPSSRSSSSSSLRRVVATTTRPPCRPPGDGCGVGDRRHARGRTDTATTIGAATDDRRHEQPRSAEAPTTGTRRCRAGAVVLGRDGLGGRLRRAADDVVASVTAVARPTRCRLRLGRSAVDQHVRRAAKRVPSRGLADLYFSDESAVSRWPRHLFGYSYGSVADLEAIPEGLATPEGIGLEPPSSSCGRHIPTSSSRPARKASSTPASTSTSSSAGVSPGPPTTTS